MELKKMFNPSSVAVIGASREKRQIGHEVLINLIEDFHGAVYPVNPNADTIEGLECYDSISDIEEAVDLAVIAVPAKLVPGVVEEAATTGVKNVIVISAGFKEVGGEGEKLESQLAQIADEYELNVVGPNSMGIISTSSSLNATFADQMALKGPLSFMSQSGAFCAAVLDWANQAGLGFNGFVSLGNKAVLDEVDFLEAWAQDPETEVIFGYLEGIERGRDFLKVARRVTPHTPVVIVKSGRTEEGAKAVSSHTGSLAGSDQAYDAALKQSGVLRARDVEELFDYATLLASQEPPQGNKVGIVSNAGGPGIMATDALGDYGFELAELTPETSEELDQILSPLADRSNPIDMTGDTSEPKFEKALRQVLHDSNVDAVLALSAPAAIVSYPELTRVIADAKKDSPKPILTCLMTGGLAKEAERNLKEAGVPNYFDPARAVRSLGALKEYGRLRELCQSPRGASEIEVDQQGARELVTGFEDSGRRALGLDSMNILEKYGIPTAETRLVSTEEEAQNAARRMKGPLVMKIASPQISHKSDIGGVRTGISAGEVSRVYRDLVQGIREGKSEAEIEGAYLQEQVEGLELILGMKKDPQFGPLLMFGLGGIYVEVLEDVAFRVAPICREEAKDMIESIQAYPLLCGARGRKPVDQDRLADILVRLSKLVVDFPQLEELDVNPLMASGDQLRAVDFRAFLAEASN
ncbi:MAG: acetate--CoA ligase alpha subunit [Candidatus Acetothermia bacterium]